KDDQQFSLADNNAFGEGSWWDYLILIFSIGSLEGFTKTVNRGKVGREELTQKLRDLGILGADETLDDFAQRHGYDTFKQWYNSATEEGKDFVLEVLWAIFDAADSVILEYLKEEDIDLDHDGDIDTDDVELFKSYAEMGTPPESFFAEWKPFVEKACDYTITTETLWQLDSNFSGAYPLYCPGSMTISTDTFGNMSITGTYNTYTLTDNGEVKARITESKTFGSSLDGTWTETWQRITYEYTRLGETDWAGNPVVPDQVEQDIDKAIYRQGHAGLLKGVTFEGGSESTDLFGNISTSKITNTYVIIAGKALVEESFTQTVGGSGPTGDNVYSESTTTYYYTDGTETGEIDGNIVRLNQGTDQYVAPGVDLFDSNTGKVLYRGIIWKVEGSSITPRERPEEFRSGAEGGIGLWGATDTLGNRYTSNTEMTYILIDGRAKLQHSKTTSTYYNTGMPNIDWDIKELVTEVTYVYTDGTEDRNGISQILFGKDYWGLTSDEKHQVDSYLHYGLDALGISEDDLKAWNGSTPLWDYIVQLLIEKGIVSSQGQARQLLEAAGLTESQVNTLGLSFEDPDMGLTYDPSQAGILHRSLRNSTWLAGETIIWRGNLKSATGKIDTTGWDVDLDQIAQEKFGKDNYDLLTDEEKAQIADNLDWWVKDGITMEHPSVILPNFISVINGYIGIDLNAEFAGAAQDYNEQEFLAFLRENGILDTGKDLDDFAVMCGKTSWSDWRTQAGSGFITQVIDALKVLYFAIRLEDLLLQYGDSNGNGEFDQGDVAAYMARTSHGTITPYLILCTYYSILNSIEEDFKLISETVLSCAGAPYIEIVFYDGTKSVTLKVTRAQLENFIRIAKAGEDYTGTITFQIINGKAQVKTQDETIIKKTEDPQNPGAYSYLTERIFFENNYDLTTGIATDRNTKIWRNGECVMDSPDPEEVLKKLGISKLELIAYYKDKTDGKVSLGSNSPYNFWVDAIIAYLEDKHDSGFEITLTLDGEIVNVTQDELEELLFGEKIVREINGEDISLGFETTPRPVYLDQYTESFEWDFVYEYGTGQLISYNQMTRTDPASDARTYTKHSRMTYKKHELYTGIDIWKMASSHAESYKIGFMYSPDEWNAMSVEEKREALREDILGNNPELADQIAWLKTELAIGDLPGPLKKAYHNLLKQLLNAIEKNITDLLNAESQSGKDIRPFVDTSSPEQRTIVDMTDIQYDEYGRMISYTETIREDQLTTVNEVTEIKYDSYGRMLSKTTKTTKKGKYYSSEKKKYLEIDQLYETIDSDMQYNAFGQLISMHSDITIHKWIDGKQDPVKGPRSDPDNPVTCWKDQRFFYDSSGRRAGVMETGIDPENFTRYFTCSSFKYNDAEVVIWSSRFGWRYGAIDPTMFRDSKGRQGDSYSSGMIFAKPKNYRKVIAGFIKYDNRPSNWNIDESKTLEIDGKKCYAVYDKSTGELIGYVHKDRKKVGGNYHTKYKFYKIIAYYDKDNNVWESKDAKNSGADPDAELPPVYFSSMQDRMFYDSELQLTSFHETGSVNGYSFELYRCAITYNEIGLVSGYAQYGTGAESGTGAGAKDAKKAQGLNYSMKKNYMVYNKDAELIGCRETSKREYEDDDGDIQVQNKQNKRIEVTLIRDPSTGWLMETRTKISWGDKDNKGGGTYITTFDRETKNGTGVLMGQRDSDKGVWSKAKWTAERIVKEVFRSIAYGLNPYAAWLIENTYMEMNGIDGAFDWKGLVKMYLFQLAGQYIDKFGENLSKALG
ncbi:MAG: hypothetical protein H8D54_02795, partial [Candidatus Omnitrophica bacterium]|nr:hypothetical protein [Candidatus Omnitrophota bacterium]